MTVFEHWTLWHHEHDDGTDEWAAQPGAHSKSCVGCGAEPIEVVPASQHREAVEAFAEIARLLDGVQGRNYRSRYKVDDAKLIAEKFAAAGGQ